MARKTEKTDDFAPNPLMESGVGKMIQVIRGKQVLLDRDLAVLYGVETKRINEQVKRNIERFPEDFCIQLSLEESQFLRSQNATLEKKAKFKGKAHKIPFFSFHRTRRSDAVFGSKKRDSNQSQHSHHAGFRATASPYDG